LRTEAGLADDRPEEYHDGDHSLARLARGTALSAWLRAVVVDDEPHAVRRLVRLLKETGRVQVVGTASHPNMALTFPGWAEVDVAFLDIVMPGMTGVELARHLPGDLLVVFITSHNEYAVQAFEVHAVDYLLKPVERARLAQTLDWLDGRLGDPTRQSARVIAEQVARYLHAGTGPGARGRIAHVAGRVGEHLQIVDLAAITHFVAEDRLVYAVTTTQERHVVDQSMEELERRLDASGFLRIHRGCIVGLAHAAKIAGHVGRQVVLRLQDGTELDVARDRVRALRERLGL
jgi:two-component system, LytTR family, response regulator